MQKKFVLTHIAENVSKMEENKRYYSQDVERFNVTWTMCYYLSEEKFAFFLCCIKPAEHAPVCAIETKFDLKLILVNGQSWSVTLPYCFGTATNFHGTGLFHFANWDAVKRSLVNDRIILEMHVTIEKMEGVIKKKNRSFDESTKEFSNLALNVDGEKFYVSKEYLASQSAYFKTLLFGQFTESNQSEIILRDIDPEDFQSFLELIHMEPLNDSCIDGVLVLCDMYGAKNAIRHCEEFLINYSKHSMKFKIRLAARFKLEKLKKHVIDSIKSTADLRSVMGEDLEELDKSVHRELLDKAILLFQ